ncbi:unnamed protein product [Prorocentrum cordatum]|uniref:Uncharacterized protein n=1 Tax=Prorocentrum cordatum TaxID=2364126 RepID=A0ABN9WZ65_9DINO|nr:unnamed protein product [Polarella glacialis]
MCLMQAAIRADTPKAVEGPQTREELQAALCDAGLSDELVELLAERERRAFSRRGSRPPGAARLAEAPRAAGVKFMWNLCLVLRLPPAAAFQAVTLLDIACLRRGGHCLAERLPVTCTVIVTLLKKSDSATVYTPYRALVPYAQQMAVHMRLLGHCIPDVTEDQLRAEEFALLNELCWVIEHCSVERWMSVFVRRFNIITRGAYSAKLDKVWEQSMTCARALLVRCPASAAEPPMALAQGLLGLCLACEGDPVAARVASRRAGRSRGRRPAGRRAPGRPRRAAGCGCGQPRGDARGPRRLSAAEPEIWQAPLCAGSALAARAARGRARLAPVLARREASVKSGIVPLQEEYSKISCVFLSNVCL